MTRVHLIEGPVGAGKSTFSTALAASIDGVHIPLDEWFAALFSPDRPDGDFVPWYVERKERLLDLIWTHSRRILGSGRDVVLELGLIQRQQRLQFCRRISNEGFPPRIHFLDAPLEVRRERVRCRNEERGPTFSMVVPDHVFEMASKLWEPPDELECEEFEIHFVTEDAKRRATPDEAGPHKS
ncbi:putative kinase [Variovorax sp. TBS-050B]|uniref:AAA family ATPase n=1 Tax=Variovorax sp. TBS-050B TaxID=2940551 RepID=UPI0024746DF0|nr:ATP-binding protein [Variovorax sp. TBS-050B]MDH6590502.1 putative kinase [Variovorax sp. TBS-050B]